MRIQDGRNFETSREPGPPVVWLASFPKSGNTWLRFLLARLLFGPLESSAELARRIPDVQEGRPRHLPQLFRGRLFLKTHWTFGERILRGWRNAAAVLLVRDPRDAVISMMRYVEVRSRFDRDQFLADFIGAGGNLPEFLQLGFGTWKEHLESWLVHAPQRFPVHLMRYEDLLADSKNELRRLAEALGIEAEDSELEASVADCRIERLRTIESRDAAAGTGPLGRLARFRHKGFTFFPRGQAGTHLEELSHCEREMLDRIFEPWLSRMGYGSGGQRQDAKVAVPPSGTSRAAASASGCREAAGQAIARSQVRCGCRCSG